MRQLWTPDQGASGLIVVARQRPLLLVVGGQVVENAPNPQTPATPLRETRSAGGLIILSRSTEKPRIVGHPDLATQTRYRRGETLYVSISEALWLESQGEDVELHFQPEPEDQDALAEVKQKVRRRWENDHLPDGWSRRTDHPASQNRLSHGNPGGNDSRTARNPGQPGTLDVPTGDPGSQDHAPDPNWDQIRERLIRQRQSRLRQDP